MTLNATPGDLNADSFITLEEAETYMGKVYFKSDWTALGLPGDATGDAAKEVALRQATQMLGLLPWIGVRATGTQQLAWPRHAGVISSYDQMSAGLLYDPDNYAITNTDIPWQVKNATAECALRLLADDRLADAGALVPANLKAGTTSISGLRRTPLPASVVDMVASLLKYDPRSGGELVRA